jgi:hypothetical protein
VQNHSAPTLANLTWFDLAIEEQGKLVKMTKRSITDLNAAGVDSFEQIKALATLEQVLSALIQKREEVREALLATK